MPAEHAPAARPVAAARRRRLRADRARQLADLLRHQILAGGFPGGVLPLEDVIAADYRASRNTVRQALDLLRGEQLVDRQPGVGTVVVGEKYPHGLDRLQGLAKTLHEHGRVTNEVRTVGPVGAPGPVAHRLGLPEHSDVLCIERLRRLNGLLPPLEGRVTQDGEPVRGPGADRALVFQHDALLPWRTVRANVELPLAIRRVPRAERRRSAEEWLERVGLAEHALKLPHRLSGGQRQRVQLARALAGRPRAVLMDEPFGALDAHTRAGMQDLLVEILRGTGATVVFVTHDVDEALHLGDRVALFASGEVLDVPHPRARDALRAPATAALRRRVLDSL
nr:ATP-binding cassette domain-containing protein [Streptomyces bikiniensis]